MDDDLDDLDDGDTLSPRDVRLGVVGIYLAFGALAFVPLSVAALLLYFLYLQPNTRIAAAKSWQETPCEVRRIDLADHGLDVLFRYEFEGQQYESTRYDLTTGATGEDAWARDAYIRLKKNPSTVCYVNPDDPSEAVLDRERRHPSITLVLPAVFGAVGLGFVCKLVFGMGKIHAAARSLSGQTTPREESNGEHSLAVALDHESAPRRREKNRPSRAGAIVAWTTAFALMAVFFVAMDGIEFIRSLSYREVEWATVEGTVDWSRDSGTSTMFGDVDEYQVRYQVQGVAYTSRCYSTTRPATKTIEHDKQRPWRGRIAGTRMYAAPRIFLILPIGITLLLLLGLLARIWNAMLGKRRGQQLS